MAANQTTPGSAASLRRNGARAALLGLVGWLLAAMFAGAAGSSAQAQEMRASAASPGYLLADSGGVITAFGGATARGGLEGVDLGAPIVDGDMTPTGLGYVLVGSDGGVFSFGDAPFLGGLGGTRLAAAIVGVDVTPTGRGYILAAADGGVFAFGDGRSGGPWAACA